MNYTKKKLAMLATGIVCVSLLWCIPHFFDSEREHVEGLSLAFVKLSSWPLGDASNRGQVSHVQLRTDQFRAVAGSIFRTLICACVTGPRLSPGPERQTPNRNYCFLFAQFECQKNVFPAAADAEDWTSRQEKRHSHLGAIRNHNWRLTNIYIYINLW